MRRQGVHGQLALVQRFGDQAELGDRVWLQVAQATVEHLGGTAGGAAGEVAGLDHGDLQATGGGVECGAYTDGTAADDENVELFGAEAIPVGFAKLKSEFGRCRQVSPPVENLMSPRAREWVLLYRTSYARGRKSVFEQLDR